MASLRVQPRDTPGERADAAVEVETSEELALLADRLVNEALDAAR